MIDTLEMCRHLIGSRKAVAALGVPEGPYILVTLHRAGNVDSAPRLASTLRVLRELELPVVFPMHPRTRSMVHDAELAYLLSGLVVLDPLGYLNSLRLQAHAEVVITDSGGIQEETTVLGVPCLTFRDNTERPITITEGTNRLIGTNPDDIPSEVARSLAMPRPSARRPALWDGKASQRIASVLLGIA
jgi:UDP-N-acetylglucosamine 2-epimerase (non-hydrolysing)